MEFLELYDFSQKLYEISEEVFLLSLQDIRQISWI